MPPKKQSKFLTCWQCEGAPEVKTAGPNAKNPGRHYYACDECRTDKGPLFLGWIEGEDAYTGKKPKAFGAAKKAAPAVPPKKRRYNSEEEAVTTEEEEEEESPPPAKKPKKTELKRASSRIPSPPPTDSAFTDPYIQDRILQTNTDVKLLLSKQAALLEKVDQIILHFNSFQAATNVQTS